MSNIASDFNNPAVGHESRPDQPKSALFTCLACQVAFPTSERQRAHYRTDWHKYNLKRKIAGLSSLNAEQFAQKVLLQQAQGKEEQEKMGLIYECAICDKSYLSENAFNNHIKSKKHLEMEQKTESQQDEEQTENKKTENSNQFLSDDEEDEHMNEADHLTHTVTDPLVTCLFCQQPSNDFEHNLDHMKKTHGFFLPDIEYLVDEKGLITYLSEKINKDNLCLYCNGRGKQWQTSAAARAHMVDRGHCKMAYDESEDPVQLLKFYDFGTELDDDMDVDTTNKNGDNELVLENGVKLGNRKFARLYKQYKPKKEIPSEAEESQNQVEVQQQPETLRRKERRHLLITDGQAEEIQKTADGIHEANIKQKFFRQVSVKQNVNTLLRARTQNPI